MTRTFTSTKELYEQFNITEQTFYNRLNKWLEGTLDGVKILQTHRVKRGRTFLYDTTIIKQLFRTKKRRCNVKDLKGVLEEVYNTDWELIGNIRLNKLSYEDNERIMVGTSERITGQKKEKKETNFWDELCLELGSNENELTLLYTLEPNSKDSFTHVHFLITNTNPFYKKQEVLKRVKDILNNKLGLDGHLVDIQLYDKEKYGQGGVVYTLKTLDRILTSGTNNKLTSDGIDKRDRWKFYNRCIKYKK